MEIALTTEADELVGQQIDGGYYSSVGELVRDELHLPKARAEQSARNMEALRRGGQAAIGALDERRYGDCDSAECLASEIEERSRV